MALQIIQPADQNTARNFRELQQYANATHLGQMTTQQISDLDLTSLQLGVQVYDTTLNVPKVLVDDSGLIFKTITIT